MKIIDPSQSPTAAALEIQEAIDEISGFVSAKLNSVYRLVNTPGRQQAIMDRMGVHAANALHAYSEMQKALEIIAPNAVPVANPEVFVAQADGKVIYIAPIEPENP